MAIVVQSHKFLYLPKNNYVLQPNDYSQKVSQFIAVCVVHSSLFTILHAFLYISLSDLKVPSVGGRGGGGGMGEKKYFSRFLPNR